MLPMKRGREVPLSPADGVERQDQAFMASTDCPWLRLEVDASALAGRWVRLTYWSGLLEDLARPVLRCRARDAATDQVLPAAVFGRAIWLGRVPEGVTDLLISPINRAGPFAFRIESIECPSRLHLGRALLARSPKRWLIWRFAPVIGLRDAADVQIRRALSATPMGRYHTWRQARTRPIDLAGFDKARPTPGQTSHLRIVLRPGASANLLDRVIEDLRAQPYASWSLGAGGEGAGAPSVPLHDVRPEDRLDTLVEGLAEHDLVVLIEPDGGVPPYALPVLAQAAAQHSQAVLFYGDSDALDGRGRFIDPQLRADWDPTLFASLRDLGPVLAVRAGALRSLDRSVGDFLRHPLETLPPEVLGQATAVQHIRRVLLTRSRPVSADAPMAGAARLSVPAAKLSPEDNPRATLIIPTKNRLPLLKACIESLKASGLEGADVIVMDNGSTEQDAKQYLVDIARDPRVRVLHDLGPFNFSRLCNSAAAQARSPILVFLNNDTEVLDGAWLAPLVEEARRPDVGAVGAKLLYPDGSVQHAGVVIGTDGLAGHFQRGCGADAPGYFGRLRVPHRVSAVTAACLAVEKVKFDAVSGFDEAHLPVDLNDVDLCLRLNRAGWKTVLVPESVLIHHESASRGVTLSPNQKYRVEQRTFKERWFATIRDDPHFHPALSLDSLDPMLG